MVNSGYDSSWWSVTDKSHITCLKHRFLCTQIILWDVLLEVFCITYTLTNTERSSHLRDKSKCLAEHYTIHKPSTNLAHLPRTLRKLGLEKSLVFVCYSISVSKCTNTFITVRCKNTRFYVNNFPSRFSTCCHIAEKKSQLTLQSARINEVDSTCYSNADTDLAHVTKTLCQFWWQTYNIVLHAKRTCFKFTFLEFLIKPLKKSETWIFKF